MRHFKLKLHIIKKLLLDRYVHMIKEKSIILWSNKKYPPIEIDLREIL